MAATVWKGFISFGLVSIPVRLYSGARAKTINFHLLHQKDNSRIHEVMYCNAENTPVDRSDLVKGYEYKKDDYVVITPEEIRKVTPSTATVMEIQEFVKGDQVDPIFLETSYYVAPEKNGEKGYALLLEAMRRSQFDGIARMTMHQREHVVILRPAERGIMLHTMYYVDEIRGVQEFQPHRELVNDKELKLANTLLESLAGDFEPQKYKDSYRENLEKLINAKLKGRKITAAPASRAAPVVDIMEALRKSLAQKKTSKTRYQAACGLALQYLTAGQDFGQLWGRLVACHLAGQAISPPHKTRKAAINEFGCGLAAPLRKPDCLTQFDAKRGQHRPEVSSNKAALGVARS